MKYEGYQSDDSIPIKRGDTVLIPKGTPIWSMRGGKATVAKTTYKVRVDHVMPGITRQNLDGTERIYEANPTVRWAGSGGYWMAADINDVLQQEPNEEYQVYLGWPTKSTVFRVEARGAEGARWRAMVLAREAGLDLAPFQVVKDGKTLWER